MWQFLFVFFCHGLCVVGASRHSGAHDQIDVSITWIRHALSCANIANRAVNGTSCCGFPGRFIIGSCVNCLAFLDPPLSNCGVDRSKYLAQTRYCEEGLFDFVGASVLTRAVETAAFTFPGYKIHVLPFLSELGHGSSIIHAACDTPAEISVQRRYMEEQGYNVSWEYYPDRGGCTAGGGRADSEGEAEHSPPGRVREVLATMGEHAPPDPSRGNVPAAMDFLSDVILPQLAATKKPTLRLALATHGQLMTQIPGCKRFRVANNNEARTIFYTYSATAGLQLAESIPCVVEEGYRKVNHVCAPEYERCPSRYMLTVKPGACSCEDLKPLKRAEIPQRAEFFPQESEAAVPYRRMNATSF